MTIGVEELQCVEKGKPIPLDAEVESAFFMLSQEMSGTRKLCVKEDRTATKKEGGKIRQ